MLLLLLQQDNKRTAAAAAKQQVMAREDGRAGKGDSKSDWLREEQEPDPFSFAPGMQHPDEFYESSFMRRVHGRLWDRDFE